MENFGNAAAKCAGGFERLGPGSGTGLTQCVGTHPKMEDFGVIEGYRTQINLDKLGYSLGVYITIKIRFGQTQRFEEFVRTVPEISECHKLTGRDCMLLRGVVRDPKHLEDLNIRLAVYGELTTSLILNSIMDGKVYTEHF